MTQLRRPLHAPRGACATSQPLAAATGLDVLRRGGNAVDAAIAAAVTLTVVQPGSNDIGGDLFAIVWDGQRLHGLNASGRSPAALTRDAVLNYGAAAEATDSHGGAQARVGGHGAVPARGWPAVTVPGAPGGWRDLHQRFGRRDFAELFQDAIWYAEHGYPVSPGVAAGWSRAVSLHAGLAGAEFAPWREVYTIDGRAPRAGETWGNPAAARTLKLIAGSRAEAFYRGEIGQALVRYAERTGGLLSADDLAKHESTWVAPLAAPYRGHEVWELPPNGQGMAALLALRILDGLPPAADEVARRHAEIEAMKLGFADAHAYVADPDRVQVPVAELLSEQYVRVRRAALGATAASPAPGDPVRGGTVYLCTADQDGMMVSLIQSNYMGFGSYLVVPGYGFGLQNRGAGFSLDPAHPNVVAPAKRPFHTIIPGFLTRDGAPVGPFGVMGGHMQPQGHLQLIRATVDGGLDPQAALDAPRWYWHADRQIRVEPDLVAGPDGAALLSGLRQRGHEVAVVDEPWTFGYGQAIWRSGSGGYVAGSEPRADGCAVGY